MNNFKIGRKTEEKLEKMIEFVKNNDKFIVLDLETTGFSPIKGGRIIEIGAVKVLGNDIVDEYSTFVNPELKIPKKITEITGIEDSMVENSLLYQQVLPDLYDFIGNMPVVAHNANFDWDQFLVYYFNKIGLYPKNEVIDTLILAKGILPARENDSMSLIDVCNRCDIIFKGKQHRALDDAKATVEVLKKAIRRIENSNHQVISQASFLDISMFDSEEVENNIIRQNVINVNLWEKTFGKRELKRLYVRLEKSNVFYDVLGNFWEVKDTEVEVDFNQIEKDVKKYLTKINSPLIKLIA